VSTLNFSDSFLLSHLYGNQAVPKSEENGFLCSLWKESTMLWTPPISVWSGLSGL
jgi:hypothetical protein